MLLTDTVALVTGSSRGVGAAIARALAREGASVCVNYFQSEDKARAVVQAIEEAGGTAFAQQADVTDEADVEAMVAATLERYGRLDVVVNNALPSYQFDPAAPYTSIETVDWSHFTQQIEGAVKGAFHTTRAVLPAMKAQGHGSILNIATNLIFNPVVPYHDYTTAKAGLLGLTRTLAAELGPHGIRVNLIAGGLLRTTDASSVTTDEVFDLVAGSTPLRRAISVDEFAESALFFASDLSRAVTGQTLAVDGGLTMP